MLVACADHEVTQDGTVGSIWWIDVAGSYQVRAFAIGGGKLETSSKDDNNSNDNNRMVAQVVNQKLQCLDFSSMTAQEGVLCILKVLTGQTLNDSKDNSSPMLVPADSEIEMAITDKTTRGKLKRFTLSSTTKQQEQHT